MALRYINLRGITIGTTSELAGHTDAMLDDQAAYNSETGELVFGPGTIASKSAGTKTTPVDADVIVIRDSADGMKPKRVTLAALKTYIG